MRACVLAPFFLRLGACVCVGERCDCVLTEDGFYSLED